MRPKARQMKPTRKPTNIGRQRQRDVGEIRHGTVGWGDGSDHFDLEPEGVPLLKVTLFAGHNTETQGQNTDPKRAKGMQILVRFDGQTSDIPNDGEHVIVARPADMETTPGSFYVIGRPSPDPKWIPNRKPGERLIQGPGDSFIRMKLDGSVHVFTRETPGETGKSVSFQVRPDGFVFEHPHIRITAGPNGYHAVHSSGARIDFGAIGGLPFPLDTLASWLKLSAAMVKIEASATDIGPVGGVPDNLAKFTPLAAMIGLLVTAVDAVGALAAAAVQTGASPPLATAAANALTALNGAAPGYASTGPTQAMTSA